MARYRKLIETYFNGEKIYNFGGLVPEIFVPTPPSPSPTPTPTITPTPTSTPAPSPVPSMTGAWAVRGDNCGTSSLSASTWNINFNGVDYPCIVGGAETIQLSCIDFPFPVKNDTWTFILTPPPGYDICDGGLGYKYDKSVIEIVDFKDFFIGLYRYDVIQKFYDGATLVDTNNAIISYDPTPTTIDGCARDILFNFGSISTFYVSGATPVTPTPTPTITPTLTPTPTITPTPTPTPLPPKDWYIRVSDCIGGFQDDTCSNMSGATFQVSYDGGSPFNLTNTSTDTHSRYECLSVNPADVGQTWTFKLESLDPEYELGDSGIGTPLYYDEIVFSAGTSIGVNIWEGRTELKLSGITQIVFDYITDGETITYQGTPATYETCSYTIRATIFADPIFYVSRKNYLTTEGGDFITTEDDLNINTEQNIY